MTAFSSTIIDWYNKHARDLPWRHTSDPYAIWLSEIILQQTRIEQGLNYWLRFMKRWPQVKDLAAASEDEVLRMWQGLGYYSRARNLLAAAQQIMKQGATFPCTYEDIRALKGVGDYTAAAIGSIAFGMPLAAVDGNVFRVLSRHYGIVTPINSTDGKKEFATLAQSLIPAKQAGTFNQAMMDFGAIQCTPKSPQCQVCPLESTCEALHTHQVERLPVKQKSSSVKKRHFKYVYIRYNEQVAIHRRRSGDIWQGLWEPLLIKGDELPNLTGTLTLLRRQVKHVLTHRIIMADFFLLETSIPPTLPNDYIWVKESDIDHYAVPRLIELLLASLPQ